jgi:hypothetical protein
MEERNMQMRLTPDELRAIVRSRKNLKARVHAISIVVMVAVAIGLLYDVYRADEPWIRLGVAWTLCIAIYLFGPTFARASENNSSEPCTRFLEREHEERRHHYLRIRNRLFLFVPGIAACGIGRSLMIVKGPSSSAAPSWLFLVTAIALVLLWIALGEAAKKAAGDRDEIRRSAGA